MPRVQTSQEFLQALHDRLDEIQSLLAKRFANFQAQPELYDKPPIATEAEQNEIDVIQQAIARQHEVITSEERSPSPRKKSR